MPSISEFSKSNEPSAVVIGMISSSNAHCALIYTLELNSQPTSFLFHIENPLKVSNDIEFSDTGYLFKYPNFIWKPFIEIKDYKKKLLSTKCFAISKANKAMPYGVFHSEDTHFNAKDKLMLGKDSSGLTCATLVKTILKECKIDIIDSTDWPENRVEDQQWKEKMMKYFKELEDKFTASILNLENIKKYTGSKNFDEEINRVREEKVLCQRSVKDFQNALKKKVKRFKPEEIAATSYLDSKYHPAKFKNNEQVELGAETLGINLIKEICGK